MSQSTSAELRIDGAWQDDVNTSLDCNFRDIWERYDILPDTLKAFEERIAMPGHDFAWMQGVIKWHQEWLVQEEITLLSHNAISF